MDIVPLPALLLYPSLLEGEKSCLVGCLQLSWHLPAWVPRDRTVEASTPRRSRRFKSNGTRWSPAIRRETLGHPEPSAHTSSGAAPPLQEESTADLRRPRASSPHFLACRSRRQSPRRR